MTRYRIRPIRPSEDPMGLTEELCVDDLRTGKRYVVVIQRVDFRPNRTPIGTGVARFTKKEDAPNKRGNIQLRTPAFYRKLEDGDDLDGAQAAELTPMLTSQLQRSGMPAREATFSAEGTVASPKEPWILCTSIRPSDATSAAALERQFSSKGPDAVVTTVDDHNAFARQLGIEVARSAETKHAVKEDAIDLIVRHQYWLACGADKNVDALVRVFYGPVYYDNTTLTVRSGGDIANAGAQRIWFTKGTKFSGECEYRFAVSAGCPATDTFCLDVSPELSRLTTPRRCGNRWW